MAPHRIIVVGAGGKLGLRLVARGLKHGHQITAFVRDRARFFEQAPSLGPPDVDIIEGDAFDRVALAHAIAGHDVVVSAAGTARDGAVFGQLFACIFEGATQMYPAPLSDLDGREYRRVDHPACQRRCGPATRCPKDAPDARGRLAADGGV